MVREKEIGGKGSVIEFRERKKHERTEKVVCLSVCMYMYVFMYVCICMYVCISMYVCMHVCMYKYVCMYISI